MWIEARRTLLVYNIGDHYQVSLQQRHYWTVGLSQMRVGWEGSNDRVVNISFVARSDCRTCRRRAEYHQMR